MTNRVLEAQKRAAYASAQQHQGLKLSYEAFIDYLNSCDPTPKGKYRRWLLNRIYKQIAKAPFDLDYSDNGLSAFQALAWFDDKKRYLPMELRNILSYQSIREINTVLSEHAYGIDRISPRLVDTLQTLDIIEQTRIDEFDGFSVHQPRSIEEIALLWGNDEWLDKRWGNGWARLKSLGTTYVILSDFGPILGVLPNLSGHRGVVLDTCCEPAMFEDALMAHNISYSDAPGIFDLLSRIDPSLPFDLEMDEVGPYIAALNQFPLILHEDRAPSDEVREALMESVDLSDFARAELEAI